MTKNYTYRNKQETGPCILYDKGCSVPCQMHLLPPQNSRCRNRKTFSLNLHTYDLAKNSSHYTSV